jgi:hypothetical protein
MNFVATNNDLQIFPNWIFDIVNTNKVCLAILEESSSISRRLPSKTLMSLIDQSFNCKGYSSDVSFICSMFLKVIPQLNNMQQIVLMQCVNKLLPLQIPMNLNYYMNTICILRSSLKTMFGAKWFTHRQQYLQYGFGQETKDSAIETRVRAAKIANEELYNRLQSKIPVSSTDIIQAINITRLSSNTIDKYILVGLCTGSRCVEILHMTDFEQSDNYGWIHRKNLAKSEKGQQVISPILHNVPVEEVLQALQIVRSQWDCTDLQKITTKYVKRINVRIRELFKESYEYSLEHRQNCIGTHFLRKVYCNYSYLTIAPTRTHTKAVWLAEIMGWNKQTALTTSINYSDIEIYQGKMIKENAVDVTLKSWKEIVKNCTESSILLTNNITDERVFLNKRGTTKQQRFINLKILIAQLEILGIVANNRTIRLFKYGATSL